MQHSVVGVEDIKSLMQRGSTRLASSL